MERVDPLRLPAYLRAPAKPKDKPPQRRDTKTRIDTEWVKPDPREIHVAKRARLQDLRGCIATQKRHIELIDKTIKDFEGILDATDKQRLAGAKRAARDICETACAESREIGEWLGEYNDKCKKAYIELGARFRGVDATLAGHFIQKAK